jgi:hypothetical protein
LWVQPAPGCLAFRLPEQNSITLDHLAAELRGNLFGLPAEPTDVKGLS